MTFQAVAAGRAEDNTSPSSRRFIPALLFAVCAGVLILGAVFVLSLDAPMYRRDSPQTSDSYVGGDVTGIAARVGGVLTRLPVADNQLVHVGELIAQIEDVDYRALRDQAQAGVGAARAREEAIEAEQRVLEDQIAQSRSAETGSLADTQRSNPELVRQRALVNTDAGVRAVLDQAVAEQRQRLANVAAFHARLQGRLHQVAVLEAQHRQAVAEIAARQADLALAQLHLSWTRIVAPVDGTLSARLVRVGDLLTPGTRIVSVTPLNSVWVDANFTERQIALIRTGQCATLRVDAFPDEVLTARVAGLSPVTGGRLSGVAADNTTGNFTKVAARVPVRVAIRWGGSRLRGLLRPGMSATVSVATGASDGSCARAG